MISIQRKVFNEYCSWFTMTNMSNSMINRTTNMSNIMINRTNMSNSMINRTNHAVCE